MAAAWNWTVSDASLVANNNGNFNLTVASGFSPAFLASWREEGEAACTRIGLRLAEYRVRVTNLTAVDVASDPTRGSDGSGSGIGRVPRWTLGLAQSIAAGFATVTTGNPGDRPALTRAAMHPDRPVSGCCSQSLWCAYNWTVSDALPGGGVSTAGVDPRSLHCTTHGEGSLEYVNYGWTADDAAVPVYACRRDVAPLPSASPSASPSFDPRKYTASPSVTPTRTSASSTSPTLTRGFTASITPSSTVSATGTGNFSLASPSGTPSLAPTISVTATPGPFTSPLQALLYGLPLAVRASLLYRPLTPSVGLARVRVEGRQFGGRTRDLKVMIGGQACTNIDLCDNMCRPCERDYECGDDKVCVPWGTGVGYCLRKCDADGVCPCDADCYKVVTPSDPTKTTNFCANKGVGSRRPDGSYVDICSGGTREFLTPEDDRLTSRLECDLPFLSYLPVSAASPSPSASMIPSISPVTGNTTANATAIATPSVSASASVSANETASSTASASDSGGGAGRRRALAATRPLALGSFSAAGVLDGMTWHHTVSGLDLDLGLDAHAEDNALAFQSDLAVRRSVAAAELLSEPEVLSTELFYSGGVGEPAPVGKKESHSTAAERALAKDQSLADRLIQASLSGALGSTGDSGSGLRGKGDTTGRFDALNERRAQESGPDVPRVLALLGKSDFSDLGEGESHEAPARTSRSLQSTGNNARSYVTYLFGGYRDGTGYRYADICPRSVSAAKLAPLSARNPNSDDTIPAVPSGGLSVVVVRGGYASTGLDTAFAAAEGVRVDPLVSALKADAANSTGPLGAVYAALPYTGIIPYLSFNAASCTIDAQCPVVDLCTKPRCRIFAVSPATQGCCVYEPTGACKSLDAPHMPNDRPVADAYIPLPREVAGSMPLPPPPRGDLNGSVMDMHATAPSASAPFQALWDDDSAWYSADAFARGSILPGAWVNSPSKFVYDSKKGYFLSQAAFYDDSPVDRLQLPFNVKFFGQPISTVYLSPNGLMRSVPGAPCNASFLGSFCGLMDSYVGLVGPMITDMDPSSYHFAEIYAGFFDASDIAPGAFAINPTTVNEPNGTKSWAGSPSMQLVCGVFVNVGLWQRQVNPLLAPNPSYTFTVCKFGDGAVRWRYGSVLGTQGVAPGYNGSASGASGGPPLDSLWLSGIRSLSAGRDFPYGSDPTRLLGDWPLSYQDVSVDSDLQILLSRTAVRPSGTAAFCAHKPIVCMNPACGSVGTRVNLQWTMPACGLGLDSLGFYNMTVSPTAVPRVDCVFGNVTTPAMTIQVPSATNSTTQSRKYSVSCVVPDLRATGALYAASAAGSTFAVPLSLQLILPANSAALVASAFVGSLVRPVSDIRTGRANGIGPDALDLTLPSGSGGAGAPVAVIVPLNVYGVTAFEAPVVFPSPSRSVSPSVRPSSSVSPTFLTRTPTPSQTPSNLPSPSHSGTRSPSLTPNIWNASTTPSTSPSPVYHAPARQYIVPHALMFTYSLDPQDPLVGACGCSAGLPGSVCDECGVCAGDGVTRDCAGECFGTAYEDLCSVCSGGRTLHAPNSDMDCDGMCFGPGRGCPSSGQPVPPGDNPKDGDSGLALTIIVIIALVTCSLALFVLLAYFGYTAIVRRRQELLNEIMRLDPTDFGVPPGLSSNTMNAMPVFPFEAKAAPSAEATAATPAPATAADSTDEKKADEETDDTCAICMETYADGDSLRQMVPCKHRFHVMCADTWLTRSTQCPVCRADLRGPTELAAAARVEELRNQLREGRITMAPNGQVPQVNIREFAVPAASTRNLPPGADSAADEDEDGGEEELAAAIAASQEPQPSAATRSMAPAVGTATAGRRFVPRGTGAAAAAAGAARRGDGAASNETPMNGPGTPIVLFSARGNRFSSQPLQTQEVEMRPMSTSHTENGATSWDPFSRPRSGLDAASASARRGMIRAGSSRANGAETPGEFSFPGTVDVSQGSGSFRGEFDNPIRLAVGQQLQQHSYGFHDSSGGGSGNSGQSREPSASSGVSVELQPTLRSTAAPRRS
jgi:uncharacterized protein with GYD domain